MLNDDNPLDRTHIDTKVDIAELTWEQKEQVLRELFNRMNSKPKKLQVVSSLRSSKESTARQLDATVEAHQNTTDTDEAVPNAEYGGF